MLPAVIDRPAIIWGLDEDMGDDIWIGQPGADAAFNFLEGQVGRDHHGQLVDVAEIQDLDLRIEALGKEKEIQADTSVKEKEQLKDRFEQQIASIQNEHKVEIRNLTEKYETQINELHNEYKAEIRKLSSRVEILAKEKDLQKEQYESQIADLDSTIRGIGSNKSESNNEDEVADEESSKE